MVSPLLYWQTSRSPSGFSDQGWKIVDELLGLAAFLQCPWMVGGIQQALDMAVAYAKEGIRINAIAPGIHDTRPVGLGISPEKQEELKPLIQQRIPMGRIGEPSEIRGLAAYLASDASSYVTGQVFIEDGGLLA